MVSNGLSAELLLAQMHAAEKRRDEALAIYQAATAEISWLHEGLRLMGIEVRAFDTPDSNAIMEMFPDPAVFETGAKPTLRQAIVTIMRRDPTASWRVTDLVTAIVEAGWLESSDAQKRVSDMAAVMVNDEQLVRIARGTYGLTPELGAAFELRNRAKHLPGNQPERRK
jgi:hypothetical protein